MEDGFAMNWERTAAATSTAAPERVWDVLLDGRRWSLWNPGVEWMVLEGLLEPGTRLTMKPKRGPQTAFRIEAVVPARLLALVVTFGPVAALRFRWELAPAGDGRRSWGRVAITGPLAGLILRRAAQRIAEAMPGNLERLGARSRRRRGGSDKRGAAVAGRAGMERMKTKPKAGLLLPPSCRVSSWAFFLAL